MAGLDIGQLGNAVITKATIRSQITPDQDVQPFAPSDPVPPSQGGFSLMSLIKPEVEFQTAMGPYIVAPYGRPNPSSNYFTALTIGSSIGAVVMLGLVAVGAFTVGKFLLRRGK
jgi:hypothetical protein